VCVGHTSSIQKVDVRLFDVGLFLTVIIIIFSSIGLACIGIGSYTMLRNDLDKPKIESSNLTLKRLYMHFNREKNR
jgi:hypothetical protein